MLSFIFSCSIESKGIIIDDLLNKLDEVRTYIPSEVYVFCGSDHFDRSIFVPITNESYPWIKPRGGMWSSPIDSENTWENWCQENRFGLEKLDKQFRFILDDGSKVLRIRSNKDLDELYSQGYKRSDFDKHPYLPDDMYYLDFEKILANGYDAIQVTITNETYWSLYGWDCDTLLVLNPDCVIEIE